MAKVVSVLILALLAFIQEAGAVRCNEWTKFYDRDDPTLYSDFEGLDLIRQENPNDYICTNPLALEAETLDGRSYDTTGDVVKIAADFSYFTCNNRDQSNGKRCEDYRVRFCCMRKMPRCLNGQWTRFFNDDSPSLDGDFELLGDLRTRHANILCERPTAIDVQEVGTGMDFRRINQNVDVSPSLGLSCRNSQKSNSGCRNYQVRFCCPL